MCPACLTTLALISVGTVSAGGAAAVIVQKIHGVYPANAGVIQKPADIPANLEDNR